MRRKIGHGLVIATKGDISPAARAPHADDESNAGGAPNAAPERIVTATDLINPQVAVGVICTSLPVTFGIIASKQAALCKSAQAVLRANYPQYFSSVCSFLKTQAFRNCSTAFYGCGLLQNLTDTCISTFGTCLDDDVFVACPASPEACYLQDAMLENLWWVLGVTAGAVASVVIIPTALKIGSHGINTLAGLDPETHPWLRKLGDALMVMFDLNGDHIVTAGEMLKPTLIVGIFSLVLPINVGTDYNTQAALCMAALRLTNSTCL